MAEPATLRQKFAALDTCVLFHLAEDHAPSRNLVIRLIRNGYTPIVTQTVVQELAALHLAADRSPKKKEAAYNALTKMRDWGVQPWVLKPVGNGICELVVQKLFKQGLLPDTEVNDACIIIEASFCNAVYLISWDSHIITADNAKINAILAGSDLNEINITRPGVILGYHD